MGYAESLECETCHSRKEYYFGIGFSDSSLFSNNQNEMLSFLKDQINNEKSMASILLFLEQHKNARPTYNSGRKPFICNKCKLGSIRFFVELKDDQTIFESPFYCEVCHSHLKPISTEQFIKLKQNQYCENCQTNTFFQFTFEVINWD